MAMPFSSARNCSSFSACSSPITYTDLAEGEHTFAVKAVDPAGNESSVTSYTWFIDLTNPVVTIDPASEPHDPTNQTTANFVFTSNKAGSTFECRLDGGQFSACTSPKAYSGLADGRHSFGVRATDSLGNVGLATVYEWTIDTVPPATTITSEPGGVTSSHSATFGFASSEPPSTFGDAEKTLTAPSRAGAPEAATAPRPFAGMKVVAFVAFWAGPFAGSCLAALGADVIKIESIQRPDGMRFGGGVKLDHPQMYEFSAVTHGATAGLRSLTMKGWQWSQLGRTLVAIAVVGIISMSLCFGALRGRLEHV